MCRLTSPDASVFCSAAGGKGERSQTFGRSRGGRTTKIHARMDRLGRPIGFLRTGNQAADGAAVAPLPAYLPAAHMLHGDKGYDSDAIQRQVKAAGVAPNIPPKRNRRWEPRVSPALYRARNAIGRMFRRLKDLRRVATRHDAPLGELPRRRPHRRQRQRLVGRPGYNLRLVEYQIRIPIFFAENEISSLFSESARVYFEYILIIYDCRLKITPLTCRTQIWPA
ncbi:transposase [Methylopila musalis]|uniref:Transposase n=1 Tax=Methylopila musalis TaxID=1134781 RepID=A0ABW3Z375_9HYPH